MRRALGADRLALRSLWLELIEHHRRLDSEYPPPRGVESVLEREIERALAGSDVRAFVADGEDGAAPVGFLLAEITPDAGWIHELFVVPMQRRAGVGRALLSLATAWFDSRAVHRRCVRVEQANATGLSFWRAAGYVDDAPPRHAAAERNARFLQRAC